MLHYYQKAKNPNKHDPLAGMWVSCGGVRDYGTKADIEGSILFYLHHFSKTDARGTQHSYPDGYDVIIVNGARGKVAGREGAPIQKSDVIRRYKPNENPVVAHYKLVHNGDVVGVRFRDFNGFFDVHSDVLRKIGASGFASLPKEDLVPHGHSLVTKQEAEGLVVRDGTNETAALQLIKQKYPSRTRG